MRHRSFLFFALIVAAALLTVSGCDALGEDEPLPFPWVKDGARMVYDFHPVADTSVGDSVRYGVYTLTLSQSKEGNYLELRGDIPQEFENNQLKPSRGDLAIKRKQNGLHSAEFACMRKYQENTQFMQRVPSIPEELLKMPRRACKAERGYYLVLDKDTTVTVPAGTFDTFVQQFQGASDFVIREYWNEKEGLIKIELFRGVGKTLRAYYALSSKNF